MPSHDFQHENLGRCRTHRLNIERRLLSRDRNIFRNRTETRAAVRYWQVVIDRLWHPDALQRVAYAGTEL